MVDNRLEQFAVYMYPHEHVALKRWTRRLHESSALDEAIAYSEACEVLLRTIEYRIASGESVGYGTKQRPG